MKKVTNCCFILCCLALSVSCRRSMSGPEYAKYIQDKDNGLKKVVTVGNWEYSILYRPHEYMVYQEFAGKGTDNSAYGQRMKSLEGTVWFNISFRVLDNSQSPLKYNVSSLQEYNQRLDYFLNYTAKDIHLIYGSDTIRPMSYLFETNYNLTPDETIIVGFSLPEKEPKRNMQIAYEDKMFQNGIIKASYTAELIKNIPHLSL